MGDAPASAIRRQVPCAGAVVREPGHHGVRRAEKKDLAQRHDGGAQAEQREHASEGNDGEPRGDSREPDRHQGERPCRGTPKETLAADRHDSRYREKPARFRRMATPGGDRQRECGDRKVPREGNPRADSEHHQQAGVPPWRAVGRGSPRSARFAHPHQDQHRRRQAGDSVGDEEQPQADPAQQRGEDSRTHAGAGQCGTEQPEGLRAPRWRHQLGKQRLARRLVDLEGEAKQQGAHRGPADTRRDGDDEQRSSTAEEADHDCRPPSEAVGHAPADQSRRHRGQAEERDHPAGGDERGTIDVHERDSQERHRESTELVDGTGEHKR